MSVNRVNESTGELVTLSSGVRCWIGTKAAHTIAVANHTIPNNVMVCITDDWKNKDDYSTEETDTGKHWIDGKPIYRKVLNVGHLTLNTEANIGVMQLYPNTNIPNMERMISFRGMGYWDNGFADNLTPMYQDGIADISKIRVFYSNTSNSICVTTWADRTNVSLVVIIEYTKSTD
jgi:hypothetical protein